MISVSCFEVGFCESNVQFEPPDCGGAVFPLVELGYSHDSAVNSVEGSFADFSYLRFGGVDQPAGWFVGLLAKFGLWFLRVMNASLLAVLCTLSSIPSFVVMFLFSAWMACTVSGCAFL